MGKGERKSLQNLWGEIIKISSLNNNFDPGNHLGILVFGNDDDILSKESDSVISSSFKTEKQSSDIHLIQTHAHRLTLPLPQTTSPYTSDGSFETESVRMNKSLRRTNRPDSRSSRLISD